MSEYWKSQERKYCDFCKCWIADNKPSVEFHEKGKRHQENVKKRLKTITQNSAKAQIAADKVDDQIRMMEQAALAAYRKDVENNADLTSKAINKKLEEDNLAISSGSKQVWHEAKSPDGNTYYWNIVTNETTWEVPKEGFLSLQEQKNQKLDEAAKQMRAFDKERQKEGFKRLQQQKQEEEEERARLEREKLKERRVVVEEELPTVTYGPIIDPGKNDPYGKWQTIQEPKHVDLQLPEQAEYYEPVIIPEPEPVVKEFKEKTVENLDLVGGSSTFKKRKFGSGAKRNVRQRIDND